jgi:hypothetical protein
MDMMTVEQAREILRTYKMPLKPDQILVYRQALSVVMRSMWGLV